MGLGMLSQMCLEISRHVYHFGDKNVIISAGDKQRTFSIDENDQFLKDGEPFRYVSGAMHYFRVPKQYWADRMLKMRAAGLNTLETYIEWSSHEPEPGVYNFDGNLDIASYFETAQKFNLSIILRPGPFIDAEREMGGLPYWLMTVNPAMKLRSSDASYVSYVERWFSVLLPIVKNHLYINGGSIITVQVENEYGSFPACDRQYTTNLRDYVQQHLGKEAVLFTTDGDGDGYLQCGKVPGVYATVDFGSGADVAKAFEPQRHFEISGPKVNSEYYPGWLDLWGQPHAKVNSAGVAKTLDEMLALNASVSIYMFHGGTTFGFKAGALPSNTYTPCITSYDYDAPLSEAGDPTEKYFAMRDVISKYLPLPDIPVPAANPKLSYGQVFLRYAGDLWDILETSLSRNMGVSPWPMTFEALKQAYGYVLYCTVVKGHYPNPALLELNGLADRAYVYIDKEFVGVLSRTGSMFSMPVQVVNNQTLCILVENQGRIAYGSGIKDFKGLTGAVKLSGRNLTEWYHYSLPFNGTENLEQFTSNSFKSGSPAKGTLSLFSSTFALPQNESDLADTFLHLPGWTKGVVFLNEVNLGRYWPVEGPQVTLYVPKFYLKPWPLKNRLIVVEQEKSPCIENDALACAVEFVDRPIIDGDTPLASRANQLFQKRT